MKWSYLPPSIPQKPSEFNFLLVQEIKGVTMRILDNHKSTIQILSAEAQLSKYHYTITENILENVLFLIVKQYSYFWRIRALVEIRFGSLESSAKFNLEIVLYQNKTKQLYCKIKVSYLISWKFSLIIGLDVDEFRVRSTNIYILPNKLWCGTTQFL